MGSARRFASHLDERHPRSVGEAELPWADLVAWTGRAVHPLQLLAEGDWTGLWTQRGLRGAGCRILVRLGLRQVGSEFARLNCPSYIRKF